MSSAMQMSSCLPRIPMEGILKVVACSIGIVGKAMKMPFKSKGDSCDKPVTVLSNDLLFIQARQ